MGQKTAIMQPYFLPYIGYWQLINAVDEFVVYDTIEYTKKGWINRNRYLLNGHDEMFSLSLKKDSDYLHVKDRELAPSFERDKLVRQLKEPYRKAPNFAAHFPLIEDIILCPENNLFAYIENSIQKLCAFLDIKTKLTRSSDIHNGHEKLKGQNKVIEICKALGTKTYINAIGGTALYTADDFKKNGMELHFLQTKNIQYPQFGNTFVPHLSILDVLMFNDREQVLSFLHAYDLVSP